MKTSSYSMKTPIGWITLNANQEAIVSIRWGRQASAAKPGRLLGAAARELKSYFAGKRKEFTVPFLLTGTEFQQSVWRELENIPYGECISYAELAKRIGKPGAVRAVGTALGKNPLPILLPCHRVIAANGRIGGFTGGLRIKSGLLRIEGFTDKASLR